MRLFFGLEPASADKQRIAEWRDRSLRGAGRAVNAANFHITLAFLGEVPPERVERLAAAADEALADPGPPLTLTLDRIGYWSRAGILWLGPSSWPDQLDRLASRCAGAGSRVGSARSRRDFTPHLTLFRQCTDAPPALEAPSFSVSFSEILLFESEQIATGVRYAPTAAWPLGDLRG
jgi:2'-5' RNA ligase